MVRYGFLAALLVVSHSWGAEVRGEICADGSRKVAGDCAADLTALLATGVDTGVATCNYNSDRSGGTTYVCVAPSATTLVDHQDVVDCNGTNESGSSESLAASGNRSVNVTGLTNGIAQRCWVSNVNPSTWESNLANSLEFTPPTPGVGGENETRLDAFLSSYTIPFGNDLEYPADPVSTSTCNAGSASAFNTCANTSGAEITITGSFSGSVSIPGGVTDIDVIMDNAYTITGNVSCGGATYAQRVRWTGGNVLGTVSLNRCRDVLFDDFSLLANAANAAVNLTAAAQPFNRVAFVNSTLANTNGQSSAYWALFMMPVGSTDLILANVKMLSDGGQIVRFQDVTRLVIADSVFNPNGTAVNGPRFHYDTTAYVTNSWWRSWMNLGANGADAGGIQVLSPTLFENNAHYDGTFNLFASNNGAPNSGTVRNHTFHYTGGAGSLTGLANLTDGGGNTRVAWDGSTVPDSSAVGAVR